MPRVSLDGQGNPIPGLALPPFSADSNLPPVTLTFEADEVFSAYDYRTLGYTHFEVTCVGAAGGRGGDASNELEWLEDAWTTEALSPELWELYKELGNLEHDWEHPDTTFTIDGHTGTWAYHLGRLNPNRWVRKFHPKEPFLTEGELGLGGAGGGGGMHVAAGMLADLPDTVPVVVGQAGNDAGFGQVKVNGALTPDKNIFHTALRVATDAEIAAQPNAAVRRRMTLYKQLLDQLITSWVPKTFLPPQPGENGGASSFADLLCQASGGKGGGPGMVWDGTKFTPLAAGGEGGCGDRLLAGGGGLGSPGSPGSTPGGPGGDGTWDGEIGKGGGGGAGGRFVGTFIKSFTPYTIERVYVQATGGGRGSYSYGDTSKYGQGQSRLSGTYRKRTFVGKSHSLRYYTWDGSQNSKAYATAGAGATQDSNLVAITEALYSPPYDPIDPSNPVQAYWLWENGSNYTWTRPGSSSGSVMPDGTYTETPVAGSTGLTAGGGGGARPTSGLKRGSRAAGFNPNGCVVVRLFKIT